LVEVGDNRLLIPKAMESRTIRDLVNICGHHFLTRHFTPQSLVLDLGGNRGEFARKVQQRWGARCLSVEANPALCAAWSAVKPV
jgi:hypothetical protein